jgi:hypothetical protein
MYEVDLNRSEENFSGLRSMSTKRIGKHFPLVPTVRNVEAVVSMITDMPIDTRWMSVKEQIKDSLECGFFTIDLRCDEDFVSYSLSFTEV